MLMQILTHTPVYVWAILAFLVFRGVAAMREREMEMKKLFIIPIVMLVLSLQDIAHKFGLDGLPLAAWLVGAGAAAGTVYWLGKVRVSAGSSANTVIVRGSYAPLASMMAIFTTKYVTAVAMAVQPQLAHNASFAIAICLLFGCFNGYFGGRLARDLMSLRSPAAPSMGLRA